jgi:hypothetical protein
MVERLTELMLRSASGQIPKARVTLPKFGNNLREIPAKLRHTENKLLALISLAA